MGRKPILTNRFDYIGKDSDAFSVSRNIINNINNCKAEISREKSAARAQLRGKCSLCSRLLQQPSWMYCDEENEDHYDDFDEFGRCEARKRKHICL